VPSVRMPGGGPVPGPPPDLRRTNGGPFADPKPNQFPGGPAEGPRTPDGGGGSSRVTWPLGRRALLPKASTSYTLRHSSTVGVQLRVVEALQRVAFGLVCLKADLDLDACVFVCA